jgi:hypothetical protein
MTSKNSEYGVEYQTGLILASKYVLKIGEAYKTKHYEDIPRYISVIAALNSETHRKVRAWWANVEKF